MNEQMSTVQNILTNSETKTKRWLRFKCNVLQWHRSFSTGLPDFVTFIDRERMKGKKNAVYIQKKKLQTGDKMWNERLQSNGKNIRSLRLKIAAKKLLRREWFWKDFWWKVQKKKRAFQPKYEMRLWHMQLHKMKR